jgi:hypothetical protein
MECSWNFFVGKTKKLLSFAHRELKARQRSVAEEPHTLPHARSFRGGFSWTSLSPHLRTSCPSASPFVPQEQTTSGLTTTTARTHTDAASFPPLPRKTRYSSKYEAPSALRAAAVAVLRAAPGPGGCAVRAAGRGAGLVAGRHVLRRSGRRLRAFIPVRPHPHPPFFVPSDTRPRLSSTPIKTTGRKTPLPSHNLSPFHFPLPTPFLFPQNTFLPTTGSRLPASAPSAA